MNARASTDGLRVLVDGQRAEAAEWRHFRNERSPDARGALFKRYRSWARALAHGEHCRIIDMGLDRADCEQLAYEALIQSIERFDPDLGPGFTSFAGPRLRGAIRNALTKANEARAAYSARRRAEKDRFVSLKRRAVKAKHDDPMDTLRELVVGMALGFMLEENADVEAYQVASDTPSAYDGVAWSQAVHALQERLGDLPDQERRVLDYHYMQGLRFAEIAALLGLSQGRISQIHSKALGRLRRSLAKFR